jgi:hypothetical protein
LRCLPGPGAWRRCRAEEAGFGGGSRRGRDPARRRRAARSRRRSAGRGPSAPAPPPAASSPSSTRLSRRSSAGPNRRPPGPRGGTDGIGRAPDSRAGADAADAVRARLVVRVDVGAAEVYGPCVGGTAGEGRGRPRVARGVGGGRRAAQARGCRGGRASVG